MNSAAVASLASQEDFAEFVASLASQKYFVFECLLDEASGWSAMSIKKQGADFNTDRFASLKAFYFIELNQVGIQVYRANDANPSPHYVLDRDRLRCLQETIDSWNDGGNGSQHHHIEVHFIANDTSFLFDKKTSQGFVSVYNRDTEQYNVARIEELFRPVDFAGILEFLVKNNVKRSTRGNHQLSTGVSSGQNCTDRSTNPEDYSCPLPQMLHHTGEPVFQAAYRAMSTLARRIGVHYAQEGWSTASDGNTWRRGVCASRYFVDFPENVFEAYTFAYIDMASKKTLLAHTDIHNCATNREIVSASEIVERNGRQYRVTIIGYMRRSLTEAWPRLKILRSVGPKLKRFLTDECTDPYQRAETAPEFFAGVGSEGVFVIQEPGSGHVLHASLMHRPHINKQMTHIASVINLLDLLHSRHPLSIYEALELCCIFGLCNSLDIFCVIIMEWIRKGLPNCRQGECLADCFAERACDLFGGVQKTNVGRCQAFIGIPPLPEKGRSLHLALLAKREEWAVNRPYVPGANKDEIRKAFLELKRVFTKNAGTSIGPFKAGEVIHVICGWRVIDLIELTLVCDPYFSGKTDLQMYGSYDAKRSCLLSLSHYFGYPMAVLENILCETNRLKEPKAFHHFADCIHMFEQGGHFDGGALIRRFFPVPASSSSDVNSGDFNPNCAGVMPLFRPRPRTAGADRNSSSFHWTDDREFGHMMELRVALPGKRADLRLKTSCGKSDGVRRLLLTPAFLGKEQYPTLRQRFFERGPDVIFGDQALREFISGIVKGMNDTQIQRAVAALSRNAHPNRLHSSVLSNRRVPPPPPQRHVATARSRSIAIPRSNLRPLRRTGRQLSTAIARSNLRPRHAPYRTFEGWTVTGPGDVRRVHPHVDPGNFRLSGNPLLGSTMAIAATENLTCELARRERASVGPHSYHSPPADPRLRPGLDPLLGSTMPSVENVVCEIARGDVSVGAHFSSSPPADPRLRPGLPGALPKLVTPRRDPDGLAPYGLCGLKRHASTNCILEGSPRRPRMSIAFRMPEECIGVTKAIKESLSLKTRKALTVNGNNPLPWTTLDCKSVVKNCLLHGHPKPDSVRSFKYPKSLELHKQEDLEAAPSTGLRRREKQCYASPSWKPCNDDAKSYDFSAAGNDLTRSICMWLGGFEVYDSGMGINLLMFDSPHKACQHLFLSLICHVGHASYHRLMVENLRPHTTISNTGRGLAETQIILLCMNRPETKSEKKIKKKNKAAGDCAQALSPSHNGFPKALPNGFHKALPNGNYLCLVHDSDGKSFLCFVHCSASAAGVPDLSSKAKSFYVRLNDPTVVRRQTKPADDLGDFPPVPSFDWFGDAWGEL